MCERCGRTFEVKPYRADSAKYCSRGCANAEVHPGSAAARDPENWETFECEWCGDEYEELASRADRTRFCGSSCRSKKVAQDVDLGHESGPESPMWKGGYQKYRGENWEVAAEKARRYDGHRCQRCGIVQEDHYRALDVHHIVPFSEFDDPEEANEVGNLTTLCASCHTHCERTGVLF